MLHNPSTVAIKSKSQPNIQFELVLVSTDTVIKEINALDTGKSVSDLVSVSFLTMINFSIQNLIFLGNADDKIVTIVGSKSQSRLLAQTKLSS